MWGKKALIAIDDPKSFLGACRLEVGNLLANKRVGFNNPNKAPARTQIWELNGDYQTQAETKRQVFSVLPFVDTKNFHFWLSIQVAFNFDKGLFILDWISLGIFEGEKTDSKKRGVLRAEWAIPKPGDRAGHAQPHWHYWSERTDRASKVLPDHSPELRLDKFHFAMASTWQTNNGAHFHDFEQGGLTSWIIGCLGYTRNQLLYLD